MTSLSDAAFRQAAFKVVRSARQTDTPVIVWEDGRIRALTPDEALRRLRDRAPEPAGADPGQDVPRPENGP